MARRTPDSCGSGAAIYCSSIAHGSGDGSGAQKPGNTPEIEMVRIADLTPYPNNPRIHPQRQMRALKATIRRLGFVLPILINENVVIVAGHARSQAAKLIKLNTVPTIRLAHLFHGIGKYCRRTGINSVTSSA